MEEAAGFSFDFGTDVCPGSGPSNGPPPSSKDVADAVPYGIGSFQSLTELTSKWLADYPNDRAMRASISDNVDVAYQTAPKVAVLEGTERRDIVPGRYLGGLKVWSCAVDVANYIYASDVVSKSGPSVLEVGCGQAIPAMAALLSGASHVTCHDFNDEVLQLCTLPNVAQTVSTSPFFDDCRSATTFVRVAFGDWDDFHPTSGSADREDELFDVILGSDVTYDVTACQKLGRLITRLLSPQGVAVIGTKEYYFGTCGGFAEMVAALEVASNRRLVASIVRTLGGTNEFRRTVVEIRWAV